LYYQSHFMNKMKRFSILIMPMIGIILISAMLSIVWYWETYGRELYFYQQIVVLNQDIKKGRLVTEDMVSTAQIEKDHLIDQVIVNKNQIIGLEAIQFIPKNAQLHPSYFENPHFTTDKNTYIVKIPNDWLYSVPNTLRRKDHVLFYQINEEQWKAFDQQIEKQQAENDLIPVYSAEETEPLKEKVSNILLEAYVAYVKDSVNREVKTVSSQERYDGSSVIAEVLVYLSPQEVEKLEQAVKEGHKFILMHTEGGE